MPAFHRNDLTGRTFTRWTVLSRDTKAEKSCRRRYKGTRSVTPAFWLCVCSCGRRRSLRSHSLLSGGSRSCGCLRAEERTRAAEARRQAEENDDFA